MSDWEKREAIRRCYDELKTPWHEEAMNTLIYLSQNSASFSLDDIRRVMEGLGHKERHHINSWDAITSRAAREGVIYQCGYVRTQNKEWKRRMIPLWTRMWSLSS